jgi:DNA transposition AAA+ family ATPase
MIDLSHPEHKAEQADLAAALVAIAKQIRDWQDAQKPRPSDEAMIRQFPGLGSSKTYKALREGNTAGLILENHLPKYRGVWASIEALAAQAAAEDIYEDLDPAMSVSYAVTRLIPNRGKERLVLIEGPTGSGKTESLRLVAQKYRGNIAEIEAHEGWNTLTCALSDILRGLGCKKSEIPITKAGCIDKIIETLKERRSIIAIDEGHHMTAQCLNVIKTIINRTNAVVVIAAIGTLWTKLTARNWEEARQLIHNRLLERVILRAPSTDDVETFLTRRCVLGGAIRSAAAKVAQMAEHNGRYAFLRRVSERLNSMSDGADGSAIIAAAESIRTEILAR